MYIGEIQHVVVSTKNDQILIRQNNPNDYPECIIIEIIQIDMLCEWLQEAKKYIINGEDGTPE